MDYHFYNVLPEEQETIINIDYYAKSVFVYSCKTSVCKRLLKSLGEPNHFETYKGDVCGMKWSIPFNDKNKIKKVLISKMFIGKIKDTKNS